MFFGTFRHPIALAAAMMFTMLTEKRLQTYQENEQQAKARYLTAITQIFSGFFQLKIFNAFSGANRAHDEANEDLYRKKLRSRRIRRILYAGAYGCGNLVVLGTWVLGLFSLRAASSRFRHSSPSRAS